MAFDYFEHYPDSFNFLLNSPLLRLLGAGGQLLTLGEEYIAVIAIGAALQVIGTGLVPFIRNHGGSFYAMVSMIAGFITNIILDCVFVWVLEQGASGAAWATIIGQIISFGVAARYLWKFKNIRLKREYFRLEKARCLTVAGLGMSSSLNQLAITLVQIVLNNSLTYYGAMSVYGSEIPLASCGIVMKTNGILMAVIIGICQGSQPILGFNYGAKQYQRVREVFKLAISCALAVSSASFLMFQIFPGYIISIFGSGDARYMEFAVKFMRTFLFMVIINGVQMLSSSMFSAIGKPLKGALLSLTRQVFFVIPLILVLPLIFGIDGILYAGPVADGAAFLLSVFLVSREFRKMREMEKEIV